MQWRLNALHWHCLPVTCSASVSPSSQVWIMIPAVIQATSGWLSDSFLSLYCTSHPLGKCVCFLFKIHPESHYPHHVHNHHPDPPGLLHRPPQGSPCFCLLLYLEQLDWRCSKVSHIRPLCCSNPNKTSHIHGVQHSVLLHWGQRLKPASSLKFILAHLLPPSHLPSKENVPHHPA